MKINNIIESRDMCTVCGQTPCNCTHLTESVGGIGRQIKALYRKIYNAGDDAIEFMYYDSPIFAQYWDEYEGDLDSIIAEVDPSELQIILDELQSAVEDQGLTEGSLEEVDRRGFLKGSGMAEARAAATAATRAELKKRKRKEDPVQQDKKKKESDAAWERLMQYADDQKKKDVSEGADDRKRNALWAQITSYEKRAKETKNDIKKQHLLKMADELRGKLPTTDEEKLAESLAALTNAIQEATMTPDQIAAAKAAAPYGYNQQTGKPNPAPATAAPAAPAATTPAAPAATTPAAPAQAAKPAAPAPTTTPAAPAAPAATTPAAPAQAANPEQAMLDRLAAKEGLPPGSTLDQITQAKEQKLLDRMGKRFGLPPGATMDQVQAAQQAHLDKNDPEAAAQYRQQMADIDAGKTPSNEPIKLKQQEVTPQTMQQYDPNFAAGMAAHKAGGTPIDMMLAQPAVAGNQQMLDAIAGGLGLPAGSTVEQIKAASAKKPQAAQVDPAAAKAAAQQKAIDDIAVKHGIPTGLTQDEFMKEWQKKVQSQLTLPAGYTWGPDGKPVPPQQPAAAAAPAAPAVAEGKAKKAEHPEADYGDDYQAMVGRLKQLAGAGPLKTVYDPQKRVYKNVPQAVQPKKEK